MSNIPMPFQMGFEMQRQSIKAGQRLFEQGLDVQKQMTETLLRNSFATQRSAGNWGVELAHETANTQFEAYESMVDDMEREFRSAMDDQFQRNAEITQEILDDQFEQGADIVRKLLNDQFELSADFLQRLLNAQVDGFLSALESGPYDGRAIIDSQFAAVNDSQDLFWREFEPEVIEAAEQLTEQQRSLVVQSTDALLDAQRDVAEQTIGGMEQVQNTT
jgi:hypothetical protein